MKQKWHKIILQQGQNNKETNTVRITIRANAKFVVGAFPKYISYEENRGYQS
jgi:hypothetical protein